MEAYAVIRGVYDLLEDRVAAFVAALGAGRASAA
jgi:hypothetical protein